MALAPARHYARNAYLPARRWKRLGDAVHARHARRAAPVSDEPANRLAWPNGSPAKNIRLTARVIVNRVWQQYYRHGVGHDAGKISVRVAQRHTGTRAARLRRTNLWKAGWSIKHLHRLVVNRLSIGTIKATPKLQEGDRLTACAGACATIAR